MYVLCGNCHNHYDDTSQSDECAGFQIMSRPTSAGSAHAQLLPTPIAEHVHQTRMARAAAALGGDIARDGGPLAPGDVAPRAAGPSDD